MDPFWARYSREFLEAGMKESEVRSMSSEEKQNLLGLLFESAGRARPDLTDATPAAPATALPTRDPEPQATLRIDKFLCLASPESARRAEGVRNYAALCNLWRAVVEELAVFRAGDWIQYRHEIQAAVKELEAEPRDGILVALILPTGARISRTFSREARAADVYIWCAGEAKMIKSMAKPGTFVILSANGNALRPSAPLGSQLTQPRVLMNVRIIE
jgi:hypothetical protein